MDVIPAGLRSEATSKYIADVVNTPEHIRVRYAFANGWGAHVRYAGGVGGPTPAQSERWDVMPGFADDDMSDDMSGELTRRRVPSWDVEIALLEIRDCRPLEDDVMIYFGDLYAWAHPLGHGCKECIQSED